MALARNSLTDLVHISKTLLIKAALCIGALPFSLIAQTEKTGLDEARSVVSEWVEVEKLISEERSEWAAEKEIIADMISLLEQERESLDERIELAESAMSEADKKRAGLVEERDEYISAMDFLGEKIGMLEAKIVELHAKFPPPLQEEVSVSFNRIPAEGEKTRLSVSQRLQTIVVILSQADKFNGGVQLISKIQDLESGPAEVDILYFGLGGAFFRDKLGQYAGIGYPSDEGWVWKEAPESSVAIATLFSVYQGTQQAEFVGLPVSIK